MISTLAARPADVEPPDSPAGRQLAWVLDMIRGGAATITEGDVIAHFGAEFLAAVPAPRHVAAFHEIADAIGDFSLARVQARSPILLLAELVTDDDVVYVTCGTDDEPPHLIVGLGFRSAESPRPGGAATPWRDVAGEGAPFERTSALPESVALDVDGELHAAREVGRVLGLAASVVRAGEVVYEVCVGLASLATRVPVTHDTVFPLGSIAKTVTAVIVMQLRDEGRLDLDDVAAAGGTNATYRQLLTHTPAGRYQYGNEGYEALGRAIEHLTGSSYPDEVRRRILDPLGMAHSDAVLSDRVERSRLAAGYDAEFDDLVPSPPAPRPLAPAAGSLFCSLADAARYAAALAAAPALLADATFAEMVSPHADAGVLGQQGIGFLLADIDGRRAAWHGGQWPGFRASLWLVRDAATAAIVVANTAAPGFEWAGRRVLERVLRGG